MQRLALRWKAASIPTAFVPTMGYLHDGHASLIRRARQAVGNRGRVVVSVFVNPTQFAPSEDLENYPRDLAGDKRLCRLAGADALFLPPGDSMYPDDFSTFVIEEQLSHGMEGVSRPTHFRGVTTVVAKLFNLVMPSIAVFGAKDFQQAAVVRRMVRDLHFPVRIIIAPTLREPDGLAMSSRNQYLSARERTEAVILWRVIREAKERVARGTIASAELSRRLSAVIRQQPSARLDYIEFFDTNTFLPVEKVKKGTHLALAVFIGKTRLIDNAKL